MLFARAPDKLKGHPTPSEVYCHGVGICKRISNYADFVSLLDLLILQWLRAAVFAMWPERLVLIERR
jgi:hypothetical protein